ncbi:MAG: hypothetical protein RSA66_10785 [Muribaculaceae bacterium]
MKIYILIFLSVLQFSCFSQNKFNCNNIDYIYLKYTDFKTLSEKPISREEFVLFHRNNHSKNEKINNKKEILEICFLLNNLIFESRLNYDTNISMKKVILKENKDVSWIGIDDIDIRALIVLYSENKPQFVWISELYTEIGTNRYYTSEDLRNYLKK